MEMSLSYFHVYLLYWICKMRKPTILSFLNSVWYLIYILIHCAIISTWGEIFLNGKITGWLYQKKIFYCPRSLKRHFFLTIPKKFFWIFIFECQSGPLNKQWYPRLSNLKINIDNYSYNGLNQLLLQRQDGSIFFKIEYNWLEFRIFLLHWLMY